MSKKDSSKKPTKTASGRPPSKLNGSGRKTKPLIKRVSKSSKSKTKKA